MRINVAVIILFVILSGCKKGSNVNLTLTGTLTDCPAKSTCTYNYYDNAGFTSSNQFIKGNYRVFWYKSTNVNACGPTTWFYFKTPGYFDAFDINSNQITAGQIAANDIHCPCCYNYNVEIPIGGEIKGKRTDSNHWLINATIILGVAVNEPVDTIVVNQYFTLGKLP